MPITKLTKELIQTICTHFLNDFKHKSDKDFEKFIAQKADYKGFMQSVLTRLHKTHGCLKKVVPERFKKLFLKGYGKQIIQWKVDFDKIRYGYKNKVINQHEFEGAIEGMYIDICQFFRFDENTKKIKPQTDSVTLAKIENQDITLI